MEMSIQNTIKDSNGDILTGRLWRKNHSFFNDLPFYTSILGMEEISGPLEKAFGDVSHSGSYGSLLVVRTTYVSFFQLT